MNPLNNEFQNSIDNIDNNPLQAHNYQRQGIAYQVHNIFDSFVPKIPSYFQLINITTPDDFYTSRNISYYAYSKMEPFIRSHFTEEEKAQKIEELKKVLNNFYLATDVSNNDPTKILIGKTIDFVFQQTPEFIDYYIHKFINDSYYAYDDNGSNRETISCADGIVERFVLSVRGAIVFVLSVRDADESAVAAAVVPEDENNQILKELMDLFDKNININEFTQKWAKTFLNDDPDLNSENHKNYTYLHSLDENARKKHYIDFITDEYRKIGLYNDEIGVKIQNEADRLNYVFSSLQFGGSRKPKTRKPMKPIKTRKPRKPRKTMKTKKPRKTMKTIKTIKSKHKNKLLGRF